MTEIDYSMTMVEEGVEFLLLSCVAQPFQIADYLRFQRKQSRSQTTLVLEKLIS